MQQQDPTPQVAGPDAGTAPAQRGGKMSRHRRQIVNAIKKHAAEPEQYENGWDVIVETLNDEQIAVLTGKTASFDGARRRVAKYVRQDPAFLAKLPDDFADLKAGA